MRQQNRWNKSFFRESLWAARNLPRRSIAAWLAAFELAAWAIFTLVVAMNLVVGVSHLGWLAGIYLALVAFPRFSGHLVFVGA